MIFILLLFFPLSLTDLTGCCKARYLMTTSLFPQAYDVFIYVRLFTSFYLLDILFEANTVSQSHYFPRVNMNLNFSLSVARRSSSWLISRQHTIVSTRHRRDMTTATRIYHCSQDAEKDVIMMRAWRKCRAHCALLRPMHKCNNNTMNFATTRKDYNLLFRNYFVRNVPLRWCVLDSARNGAWQQSRLKRREDSIGYGMTIMMILMLLLIAEMRHVPYENVS